ncbi:MULTISPECIES: murein hydrolase activator EnvC family protein [Melioribacter]|uniref:murein hydrolase activator EnvC family protein n=1 Tax=Melioribacter TaxID=1134403 RepID=UPI0012FF52C3|nr:peptidoglycan DD-metalloendopeptidase family protein [Melioribacter roseus]
MKRYLKICLLILAVFYNPITAQVGDSINFRNEQLENLKSEIAKLERELNQKTQKEKESLQALENLTRQNTLLQKILNNIAKEEINKEKQIAELEKEIAYSENKIRLLQDKYSKYIVWIYKYRGKSYLKYLLNTSSPSKILKRYRYFKSITEQNRKDLKTLRDSKNYLVKLKNKLTEEKRSLALLKADKKAEQDNLARKEVERKKLIAALRKDKKHLAEEIESKRKAEIVIKNIIARLIEEERQRRELMLKENEKMLDLNRNYNYNNMENFSLLKGKLAWPIRKGKIIRKFGENRNRKLNTVTLNYGVDILTSENADVYAVAEGVVSAIEWIPGYGSVVIVTHRDEYRTVYGHIKEIYVEEGQVISGGSAIGKVNESLEGNVLHFEIWNSRNYQNPEVWLSKK